MADRVQSADRRVSLLAGRLHGVLGIDELRSCGLSDDQVSDRARDGYLHRRHRGVYLVGHTVATLHGEFLAALTACGPEAVLGDLACCAL